MTTNKIIICDDEEGIRESLKLILEDHYELIVVTGGKQCLETLEHASDIGLVCMDIRMPQVNGLDVLKEIKKKHPKLPVIMITGYKSVELASESAQLGACGYIVKPFKSKEILDTVRKHVDGK